MNLRTFTYGSVTFSPGSDGRERVHVKVAEDGEPASKEAPDAQGSPDKFIVSFVIEFSHGDQGFEVENTIQLDTSVVAGSRDDSYLEVEAEAAERLPGLLRNLADAMDRQMAET